MAACYISTVKQNVFVARERRYDSALEASCGASHLPTAVFHNLVATYRKHLPIWHRYWEARRRILGHSGKLPVHDWTAPLATKQPQVSFEKAMEWICAGMRPLGDEYVAVMRRGVMEERWVDRYPNQNKHGGAHSGGSPGTHPFILMSFTGDLQSMSTLAHELGHSMHSWYTWRLQPFVYCDYSNFVAEVASNFDQALVRAHLFVKERDPDFQLALIEEAMGNFHRYFFLMPALARFELAAHQREERGEGLSAESLMADMTALFREAYGPSVEIDEPRVGITWAQFPVHLVLNFYVYQYATGIAAAHALAEGVLAGKPRAAEKYLKFLASGGSLYPIDALKMAGVDMTTPEPVEQTFRVLERFVERLEVLAAAKA
jgi:oligoendopeptidase F